MHNFICLILKTNLDNYIITEISQIAIAYCSDLQDTMPQSTIWSSDTVSLRIVTYPQRPGLFYQVPSSQPTMTAPLHFSISSSKVSVPKASSKCGEGKKPGPLFPSLSSISSIPARKIQ
jgi:hypothetical protein